ncbi:MAG: deoxyribose-phosphate aldolase [Acidobacteria bacterium]|nr:deoxyribose-phosphate aldolase [Acidobacteriota bacterium]
MDPLEFQQLVEQITKEIFRRSQPACSTERCACHTVSIDQCPDRMRLIIECGAERIGTTGPMEHPLHAELARYIDHTLLKPDAIEHQIVTLCEEARRYSFATVCVNPTWVSKAHSILKGTAVAVSSVVGFPLGATTSDVKSFEARHAIFDGAREIDMVINIGALKSGCDSVVRRDIESVVTACHDHGAITKVIIETALLSDDEKVKACTLAKEVGADFVKTSTGFASGGATVEDVALMRRVVGSKMGVKAAGGIKDSELTRKMIEAGANRIGASAGVKIVQGQRESSGY